MLLGGSGFTGKLLVLLGGGSGALLSSLMERLAQKLLRFSSCTHDVMLLGALGGGVTGVLGS